jgi:hypothetical protein
MKSKILQGTLFALFNIGFVASVFFLMAWLNESQNQADAIRNELAAEFSVGRKMPFDDIEITVTDVNVQANAPAPEIPDPLVEFGGLRTMENCVATTPDEDTFPCEQRNTRRSIITTHQNAYNRNRLTFSYTIRSTAAQPIDLSKVNVVISTFMNRDVKKPDPVTPGTVFVPYGESSPTIKNGGKEVTQQIWTDLYPDAEPTATITFGYNSTTRKFPVAVEELAQRKP